MPTVDPPIRTLTVDSLPVEVYASEAALGTAAAAEARQVINAAIAARNEASIIVATGNSQLAFLRALRAAADVDWSKVRVFHMDEYVGLPEGHSASFPRFLQENFLSYVSVKEFFPVRGDAGREQEICDEYEALLRKYPADMVALGWGENGHLAFNDPPYAKFDDERWVKVIELADASRKQQVGEGHFASLDEVPTHAITVTIPALLAPGRILCIVPEARKAPAVTACLYEPVSEDRPGSILRTVENARLYLDPDSGKGLR